jgi:DNA-binding response OmpR family regulator
MRVLVVKDHKRLAEAVATGLREEGMAVDVVFDGQDALDRVALACYDVIVLDRDLPGRHGDQVCQELAVGQHPSRVLMLTAASTIADRVEGLGLGADDYLPKPFDFAELVARIRALGRRAVIPLPPSLTCGDLSVDPARRVAVRAGRRACPVSDLPHDQDRRAGGSALRRNFVGGDRMVDRRAQACNKLATTASAYSAGRRAAHARDRLAEAHPA